MIDRIQLKLRSREQIRGQVWFLFLCCCVVGIFSNPVFTYTYNLGTTADPTITPPTGTLLIVALFTLAFIIIGPSLTLSLKKIFIGVTEGDKPHFGDLFWGFSIFGKALWLNIITSFFMGLWALLFLVPGIVKYYAYYMAPYVLADNPTMTAREALSRSKDMTRGYKGEIFVMELSFILWGLLVLATLGIAAIYVVPYTETTRAAYYQALKNKTSAA